MIYLHDLQYSHRSFQWETDILHWWQMLLYALFASRWQTMYFILMLSSSCLDNMIICWWIHLPVRWKWFLWLFRRQTSGRAEACIQALDIDFTEGQIYEISSIQVLCYNWWYILNVIVWDVLSPWYMLRNILWYRSLLW